MILSLLLSSSSLCRHLWNFFDDKIEYRKKTRKWLQMREGRKKKTILKKKKL